MTTQMAAVMTEFNELKLRLRKIWMAGDYDVFSRHLEKGAEPFFRRLPIGPGVRVLDVACGSGQLALMAARSGAGVRGCDIAANWIERARARAAAEQLPITFDEADAEDLPYRDGEFDIVVSLIGAMFAPRPHHVASEMLRVCRAGGTIAMANWTPGGFVGRMFKTIARHIAPSGMPAPVLWGEEEIVRERFGKGVTGLSLTRRMYEFDFPFPPAGVVDFFRTYYGPMACAFASLDTAAQDRLRTELIELWAEHNLSPNGGTLLGAEYLEVIATRQ